MIIGIFKNKAGADKLERDYGIRMVFIEGDTVKIRGFGGDLGMSATLTREELTSTYGDLIEAEA